MPNSKLFLHEEVLLLALRDEEGTVASGTWYTMALGGAILAELLLQKRISVETERKKQFAKLVNSKKLGDDVLNEAIEKLSTATRRATLQTWTGRFANIKNLKHRVANALCKRGILRADEKQILLFFTQRIYPERDGKPEKEIIEQLRRAVFTNTREVLPRTVVLLSLADSSGLLKVIFDKKKLRGRKDRIEKLVNGEVLGQATKEAIQAAQAAVMVATIIPAVTVTTMSH